MSGVLANRFLRKVFGPKKEGWRTGDWRKISLWGLLDLYSSPHIIRLIKLETITWAVQVACMGENRNTCRAFVEKPEVNGQFVMPG